MNAINRIKTNTKTKAKAKGTIKDEKMEEIKEPIVEAIVEREDCEFNTYAKKSLSDTEGSVDKLDIRFASGNHDNDAQIKKIRVFIYLTNVNFLYLGNSFPAIKQALFLINSKGSACSTLRIAYALLLNKPIVDYTYLEHLKNNQKYSDFSQFEMDNFHKIRARLHNQEKNFNQLLKSYVFFAVPLLLQKTPRFALREIVEFFGGVLSEKKKDATLILKDKGNLKYLKNAVNIGWLISLVYKAKVPSITDPKYTE